MNKVLTEAIQEDRKRINELRNKVIAMNIDDAKKEELLNRLDSLNPTLEESHGRFCGCNECEKAFDDTDENNQYIEDPTIAEVYSNISNPIIPKIMNNKFVPFIVIGVGIAICVIGFKMYKKRKVANPTV